MLNIPIGNGTGRVEYLRTFINGDVTSEAKAFAGGFTNGANMDHLTEIFSEPSILFVQEGKSKYNGWTRGVVARAMKTMTGVEFNLSSEVLR